MSKSVCDTQFCILGKVCEMWVVQSIPILLRHGFPQTPEFEDRKGFMKISHNNRVKSLDLTKIKHDAIP